MNLVVFGYVLDVDVVLLRLSKPIPKPRFFGKTEPNRNRGFMPLTDGSVLKWSSCGVLNVNSRLVSGR